MYLTTKDIYKIAENILKDKFWLQTLDAKHGFASKRTAAIHTINTVSEKGYLFEQPNPNSRVKLIELQGRIYYREVNIMTGRAFYSWKPLSDSFLKGIKLTPIGEEFANWYLHGIGSGKKPKYCITTRGLPGEKLYLGWQYFGYEDCNYFWTSLKNIREITDRNTYVHPFLFLTKKDAWKVINKVLKSEDISCKCEVEKYEY